MADEMQEEEPTRRVYPMDTLFRSPPVKGDPLYCAAPGKADGKCGRLLRDSDGNQVREDVACSRLRCPHAVCVACLLKGVVAAGKDGKMFQCAVPGCQQDWLSWDTRSRMDQPDQPSAGGKRAREADEPK